MNKYWKLGLWVAVLVVGGIFLAPQPAHAQFANAFDPAGSVQNFATSNGWLTKAQGWARTIYVGLIIFELIALGITSLLFRDNLGEFFAGVTLKIVLGSVFFWFISVAGPGLTQLPGQVIATFGGTFGQGMGGSSDVNAITAEGLSASGLYFGASYAMRQEDGYLASLAEAIPPNCTVLVAAGEGGGVCYRQPSETIEFARQAAELLTSGLGVMVGMAVAAVYLQLTLITIESWIVMTAGTLFIGFAGSRFTMPFAQGYFSYMISVGVKLMALYLAIGLVGPLMINVMVSAIGSLIASLLDPTGFTALASGVYGALSVVVGSGIIAMVPGFAASFISGSSSASGSAVLSQAASTIAGSAQMMAQMSSASSARREASREQTNAREVAGEVAMYRAGQTNSAAERRQDSFAPAGTTAVPVAAQNGQGPTVLGDTLGVNRPAVESRNAGPERVISAPNSPLPVTGATAKVEQPVPAGQQRSTGDGPVNGRGDGDRFDQSLDYTTPPIVNPATGQQMSSGLGGGSAPSLVGVPVSRLEAMPEDEVIERMKNTQFGDLSDEAKQWVAQKQLSDNRSLADVAISNYEDQGARALVQSDLAEAYALSGLAQSGIRDIGSPSAVQVRLSSPDKL